jgi:hypothetical protein
MTRAYVLVEGQTDAELLKKVLPPAAQQQVEFVVANGSIASLARSYLVRRRVPVAVFMDADSLNPEVVEERRQSTEELIRAASAAVPVKVVVVVPELESLFFAAPEVIEKVLGQQIAPIFISLGERDPKGVLSQLAAAGNTTWDTFRAIAALDAQDLERIRATAPVQELISFLQNLPEPAVSGTS